MHNALYNHCRFGFHDLKKKVLADNNKKND